MIQKLRSTLNVGPIEHRPTDEPDWPWFWVPLIPCLFVFIQALALPLFALGVTFSATMVVAWLAGGDLLSAILTWYLLCWLPGKPLRSLGLRLPRRPLDWVTQPLFGGLLTVVFLVLSQQAYGALSGGRPPPPQKSVEFLATMHGEGLRILVAATVVLVVSFVEELVFRGVVFRGLRRRAGLGPALVLSAAAFSLAHLDFPHFLQLFGTGIALGVVVEKSRSLYPSMILHAGINLISLLFLYL